MKSALAVGVLCLAAAVACVCVGYFGRGMASMAREAKTASKDQRQAKRKNSAALSAGIRTEQAQAVTDTYFNKLRTDYENEKDRSPGIGCVLDPVSLRVWNDANAQSDGAAASKPDGGLPDAAAIATEPERSD